MRRFYRIRKLINQLIFTVIILLTGLAVYLDPVIASNLSTLELSRKALNENSLKEWATDLQSQHKLFLLNGAIDQNVDTFTFLQEYPELSSEYNKAHAIDLMPVKIKSQEFSEIEEKHAIEVVEDANYFDGEEYTLSEGKAGRVQLVDLEVEVGNKILKADNLYVQDIDPVVDEVKALGKGNNEKIAENLIGNRDILIEALRENNKEEFERVAWEETDYDEILDIANKDIRLSDLAFSEFIFDPKEGHFDNIINVGAFQITNLRCNDTENLNVVYDKYTYGYYFSDAFETISSLCDDNTVYVPPLSVEILACNDCTYAPVDKEHALPSKYIPEVVGTGLSGGGTLTPETVAALKEFFSDAKANGFNMTIVSAYRSYKDQVSTFDYWVRLEMSRGASRSVAEDRANVYSAKPGHSEHQLGTTVDLGDAKCSTFSEVCNKPIYEYIGKNAHRFGFVVSYPKNTQSLTGYKHEAWHVRYVGNEMAQEMFDTGYINGNGYYLAKLLKEKALY